MANKFLFDLGVKRLSKDWKDLCTTKYLKEDFFAGLNVAAVALPLSLAVGLASSVEPEVGLVTAVVASIAVALFGGTPLAISGPAAAMSVLLATVVQQYGFGGLLLVGLGCGVLQVLTGVLRLGQLVHFVPLPVVSGFVAGIGALLLIGQIPAALGLPVPSQSKIFDVLTHVVDLFHQARWESFGLAIGTVAIIYGFSKVSKRVPSPLIAVVVCSFVANFFNLHVEMIGEPMETLFRPRIPSFNSFNIETSSGNILGAILIVYFLASLETLLSSGSVDRLSKTQRHNPDQELIGQGIGNILVSFFGGIPATGVFVRSMLNVKSGAKTRRAAIIHALVILFTMVFFLSWIAHIPLAVLAGMLFVVSMRMLQPKELIELWRTSRVDAGVYIVTFVSIVGIDLAAGIQTGIVLALVIAAVSLGRVKALIQLNGGQGPVLVSIDGPLTFMASSKTDLLREKLSQADLSNGVLMDLSEVTGVDTTGVSQLIEVLKDVISSGNKVAIKGASAKFRKMLVVLDPTGEISNCLVFSETEIMEILKVGDVRKSEARLKFGVERFRKVYRPNYLSLLKRLAIGQNPHTLYITCSDSRINPNLITATDPGELFIVRNVGNIVPQFGADNMPAEGAAIEYAIGVLGVKDIVVCGHSECGAMNAVFTGQIFENESTQKLPSVARWLMHLKDLRAELPKQVTLNQMSQYNVIKQLENLKTYPIIKERIEKRDVRIHAWFYDLALADIHEWNPETNLFTPLGRLDSVEVSSNPVQ
jgi:carbonic anhydrase